jgi:hypothetical protein
MHHCEEKIHGHVRCNAIEVHIQNQ